MLPDSGIEFYCDLIGITCVWVIGENERDNYPILIVEDVVDCPRLSLEVFNLRILIT